MWRLALSVVFAVVLSGVIADGPAAGAEATTRPTAAVVDPAVRQRIEHWVATGMKEPGSREAAELALSRAPVDAWPAIEAVAEKASADAPDNDAKQWLGRVLRRQRPYFAARARRWQAERTIWEWNRRTALEAYDRAGRKSPKWDEAARRGISGFVGMTAAERQDGAGLAEAIGAGL